MSDKFGWLDWLSAVGSVLSIFAFFGFSLNLARRFGLRPSALALREACRLMTHWKNVVMLVIVTLGTALLVYHPPGSFPASLTVLIPVVAGILLAVALFLAQSGTTSGAVVVREIARIWKQGRGAPNEVLAAARFDIDRLKAIGNYSQSTADDVRKLVRRTIQNEIDQLTERGHKASVVDILGEDETVVAVLGVEVRGLADLADRVRRSVTVGLHGIPYYSDAVDFVVASMSQGPAQEERDALGTVSVGVGAYRGNPEMLFSDISAAVKESKCTGRNKTVVYKPGEISEIRP